MTYAILFPGQGSQSVDMCPDVRDAYADRFTAASAILGWDLESMIAAGPEDVLTATEHAQPALFVTSLAMWEAFSSVVTQPPSAMAGHSLGEYTALAAAGSLPFVDGVAVVSERGRAMAASAAERPSGMAALIGGDDAAAEAVCAERRSDGGALYVANLNAPGQVVVAGGPEDLAWLEDHARDFGIRRAIVLKVAGGFHSPFMDGARDRLAAALDGIVFDRPAVPVYANATAVAGEDPAADLIRQLTAPVRFSETIENMVHAGVDTFVHVGPGDVTAGLARRCAPDAEVAVVSTIAEARSIADMLSVQ